VTTTGGDQKTSSKEHARRIEKLAELRDQGIPPYPDRFARTHGLAEAAGLPESATGLVLAGRLISRRKFGKLTFCHLQDGGGKLQIALERDKVAGGGRTGRDAYQIFQKLVDVGDFVGVEGDLMRTKTGELTLDVRRFTLLSKALRPLPEKFHGLRDLEACYRQRYLDLLANEETRERFALRSRVIRAFRDGLDRAGFLEVDTPVMVATPSGALATPFVTHHRALDMPAFLRIAPETYLKRLLVGGYERVYEFARSFRNEGMDPSHLQEFTLLEYYGAYWNYEDNMAFTERLMAEVVEKSTGSSTITFRGHAVDFSPPWPRVTFEEALSEYAGVKLEDVPTPEALRAELRRREIEVENLDALGWGSLLDQLYKKCCRPHLIRPTFLTGHPIELSPLARRSDADPRLTDRFQLLAGGWEIVNAYSELVDPVEQRERFEEQAALRRRGDEEAMPTEEDYLRAMEYGMPPVSGWGLGLERFLCLLSDRENLRDVVYFPFMRPQDGSAGERSEADSAEAGR
jgi:lysyl-tRNA synthetase class 2